MKYWAFAVLAGCSFRSGGAPDASGVIDTPMIDAPMIDARIIDAPAACTLWHPHHFAPCVIGAPESSADLPNATGYTYDTTNGTLKDAGGNLIGHSTATIDQGGHPAWLMNVQDFTLHAGATLRVIGNKPLIIAAWGAIDVSGTIDASSFGANAGAGSNPGDQCNAATQGDTGVASGGSGGGGGGAFQGDGGKGGIGDSPPGPVGGNGGTKVAVPHIVRGGCSGAPSGKAGPGDTGDPNAIAAGGPGGGGIQLTAQHALSITGKVLAGGAGGAGAPLGSASGGGGAGSGGYLGLEGETITIATGAIVAANGGGGGASAPFTGTGTGGQDSQASATAALGAPHQCTGTSDGGNGGTTGNGATVTGNNQCGGGGGGGGTGFVVTFGPTTTMGTVSPAAIADPFTSPN